MFDWIVKRIVVWLLVFINPKKPYGTALFNELVRLTGMVSIEAVCLRKNPDSLQLEVYLIQRSINEVAYPGQWHCPGSIYRPEETDEDVFDRLAKTEFFASFISKKFVSNLRWKEERGDVFSTIWICALAESEDILKRGKWFPIDHLPDKIVGCHREKIIPIAVKAFELESLIQFVSDL